MALHEPQRLQERLRSVSDPVGFLVNLFTHAPVGFAVWTADGHALLTNRAFMELFHAEPPPEYNVLKDDILAANGMLALFERAFAGETVHVPTFWYDPRDLKVISVQEGRRVAISMTIFPLFKPDGSIDFVAATYKDDTEILLTHERLRNEGEQLRRLLHQMEQHLAERQRMEEEHARLEAQLRQSQKMEALGTLSGGIAHDFNNLLTAIIGNTKLAREDLPPDHPVQPSLDEVYRAGLRSSELVRRILAFGRPQATRRAVVKLEPIVDEVLQLLRSSLPAMVEIRSEYGDHLPSASADPSQVHQVLMNLGTNAAQAMAARGGLLEVRVEAIQVDAAMARVSADLREGPYLRVVFSDDGCGMEPAVLARVFEPFFTTKAVGHGTGLGLAMVHGIMKSHDGAVTVYSEPGRGTTFHLYFPAATNGAAEAAAAAVDAAPGRGEHILHVDDEEALSFLAARSLERLGYRVTSHVRPSEALQDFRARPGDFDAVVTDLSMPGMSGVELARAIVEIRSDLPVVLASGYFRPEDELAARAAGVRELLLKPNTVQEMGQALSRLLGATAKPR